MTVAAGYNTLAGGFAIADDATLARSGAPASAMVGCADDVAAQDAWIAEVLTAAPLVAN